MLDPNGRTILAIAAVAQKIPEIGTAHALPKLGPAGKSIDVVGA
jgi:hypothetical protein